MKDIHLNKYLLILVLLLISFGCKKNDNNLPDNSNDNDDDVTFTDVWDIDTVKNGLIHYHFSKYDKPQGANQNVNVLKLDLSNPNYKLKFIALDKDTNDSLSSVAIKNQAIAGINGAYGRSISFVKADGHTIYGISNPGGVRFWKYEGAFFYNDGIDAKISYGTKSSYTHSNYLNIISGAPVLIDDFKPVGKDFIGDVSGINIDTLPYEDYRRHQGVRHPRTAIALTKDNCLLLISVDGRDAKAAGMTAKELTQFVARYFDPKYALNLDGGGSTTMYIRRKSINGIVNYPADNNKYDHYGQRLLYSFILIKEVN